MPTMFNANYIVNIIKADFLDVQARTLVNPLNEYLLLSKTPGHISTDVAKYAGESLQKELDDYKEKNGQLEFGGYMRTGGYNLFGSNGIKTIIHTATKNPGPNGEYLEKALTGILSEAAIGFFDSPIVMPLLGCGTGGFAPLDFIKLLKKVADDVFKKANRMGQIVYIIIPVHDEDVYNELKRAAL